MDDAPAVRYWCHMCADVVDPVMEPDIKCPLCDSGFVEEMNGRDLESTARNLRSERSLSLWAPILLGMMGSRRSSRRSRLRTEEENDEEDDDDDDDEQELEDFIRRRRGSSLLQVLQSIRDDVRSELDYLDRERAREGDGEREGLILIDSNNHAIILQGSFGAEDDNNRSGSNHASGGSSIGDYFLGAGLDLLLQHLAENDPNRYGTPPAKKEAVDALPTVRIEETLICSVCLEDLVTGAEVKEMPCKHKFHGCCILPWLELHSSCPVCRFQLPAGDESKNPSGSSSTDHAAGNNGGDGGRVDRSRGPIPWPFSGLFSSSSGSRNNVESSSNPSSRSASSSSNSASSSSAREN